MICWSLTPCQTQYGAPILAIQLLFTPIYLYYSIGRFGPWTSSPNVAPPSAGRRVLHGGESGSSRTRAPDLVAWSGARIRAPEIAMAMIEGCMPFILGLFLFVVVIGALDALLPWPKPGAGRGNR